MPLVNNTDTDVGLVGGTVNGGWGCRSKRRHRRCCCAVDHLSCCTMLQGLRSEEGSRGFFPEHLLMMMMMVSTCCRGCLWQFALVFWNTWCILWRLGPGQARVENQ